MMAGGQAVQDWIVLGRIAGPYGIKGWLRVQSFTEPADNLAGYKPVWIGRSGEWKETTIRRFEAHGKGWVAQLKGCDDRNAAEALAGAEIAVPRQQLPALKPGEYYWTDLEGSVVYNRQGEFLGLVDRLLETGANDVLLVVPAEGSLDDQERLIPWVPDRYVVDVDLAAKRIEVDWEADF